MLIFEEDRFNYNFIISYSFGPCRMDFSSNQNYCLPKTKSYYFLGSTWTPGPCSIVQWIRSQVRPNHSDRDYRSILDQIIKIDTNDWIESTSEWSWHLALGVILDPAQCSFWSPRCSFAPRCVVPRQARGNQVRLHHCSLWLGCYPIHSEQGDTWTYIDWSNNLKRSRISAQLFIVPGAEASGAALHLNASFTS